MPWPPHETATDAEQQSAGRPARSWKGSVKERVRPLAIR
jgi:hypothetical protein